jgi:flagellar protein FliO/FliZ
MTQVLLLIFGVAFAAAALVGLAYGVRKMTQATRFAPLFAPKPQKRIDVIEQATVDAKRKLLLVRRDDVEHLIMTGGPVDIVIESGIGAPRSPREALASSSSPTRPPRPLGQAAE